MSESTKKSHPVTHQKCHLTQINSQHIHQKYCPVLTTKNFQLHQRAHRIRHHLFIQQFIVKRAPKKVQNVIVQRELVNVDIARILKAINVSRRIFLGTGLIWLQI